MRPKTTFDKRQWSGALVALVISFGCSLVILLFFGCDSDHNVSLYYFEGPILPVYLSVLLPSVLPSLWLPTPPRLGSPVHCYLCLFMSCGHICLSCCLVTLHLLHIPRPSLFFSTVSLSWVQVLKLLLFFAWIPVFLTTSCFSIILPEKLTLLPAP